MSENEHMACRLISHRGLVFAEVGMHPIQNAKNPITRLGDAITPLWGMDRHLPSFNLSEW